MATPRPTASIISMSSRSSPILTISDFLEFLIFRLNRVSHLILKHLLERYLILIYPIVYNQPQKIHFQLLPLHLQSSLYSKYTSILEGLAGSSIKYLREEYLIDALADYKVEPDDPTRSIPNPARKAVVQEVYAARVRLRKLRESYGATAIDYIHGSISTDPDFEIAEEKIRMEIEKATNHIKKLKVRRDSLPARVTVADAQKGQEMVKLSTERKHLTNVLKMVAYQTESDLVELIRPHYSRVEDEGRTFIQTALQDTADIEPAEDQLRITLAPLSSPHRSRVLEALCETLNETNTLFPGTRLQMHYVVVPSCLEAKSGQVTDNPCQEF